MNPDQPVQPNNGSVQPQGTPTLDPSVVALTKAIGKAETPDTYGTQSAYNNPSPDPGSPASAYQFTPGFIDEWGPSVLGSQYQKGNYSLTPAQQDELAYGAIKTMGTTGDPGYEYLGKLTPKQIASAWNSGDPNAYLEADYQGTKKNANGQSYNVPDYVNKVEDAYNSIMGTPTANAATSPNSSESSGPSLMDTILGVGSAAGGWLLSKAWQYGQKPLTDAAIDAGAGAVLGSETGPGALATAGIGGLVGLGTGIVSDFTDGNNSQSSTPTSDQTAQTSQPAQPDVNAEVAADAGKANPLPPEQNPQPQNQQSNQQSTPQEQQDQEEIQKLEAEMPQANQASQKVAQQIAQDYGTTIPGQRAMDDKNVKEGIQEAGINGWGPEVTEDENGVKRNDYKGAIGKANGAIHETSQNMEQMLDASGATGSMAETLADAENDFNKRSGIDASERAQAKEYFKKQGDAYLKESGKDGKMTVGKFEKMKREKGHGKKWDATEANWKREADKSLSRAARRTVERSVPKEVKDLYNRANKKMERMINARKVMEKLDKKKGTKNKSLLKGLIHAGGRYAALYIGDKIGGPLGAILGSMAGDYVTRAVDRRFGKTLFETPAMRKGLEILQKQHPHAYTILQYELKKAGIPKQDFTNPPSSIPTQNKPQSPRKPKGKAHKGLIRLSSKRPKRK